jgi:DNA-binding transcriptional LysR family regulator
MTRDAREPSLELLQTLLLFEERGEVSAVAQALGLDQAVVSRRMKQLREKYGLIQGDRRGLALTSKARSALPAIRSLLRQHGHLAEWLKGKHEQPQVISIATGSFGARVYLPRAIAAFQREYPDWQVCVQIRRGRERILGVADGTFDLATVSHDEPQIRTILAGAGYNTASVRIEPLAEHPLCLVAGKDTPLGRELSQVLEGQTVPLEMLTRFPLVGLDPQSGIRRQFESHIRGKSPALHFRFEAGGWEAAKEYARHGLGVAVVPLPNLCSDDRSDLIIRQIPAEIRNRDLLIGRDGEMAPAHERMKLALKGLTNRLLQEG